MSTGVEFGIEALRVEGSLVRTHPFTIEITPVIETGELHVHDRVRYREPDQFLRWELTLRDRRRTWRRDRKLWRVLRKGGALEFWTTNEGADPWVHWLMVHVTWRKNGSAGVYLGVTNDGPEMKLDDIPDGKGISHGGYWKTSTPPPSA